MKHTRLLLAAAFCALLSIATGASSVPTRAQKGMVAVHAVVEEDHINALLPQLKKAGATGILVLPIERMVP